VRWYGSPWPPFRVNELGPAEGTAGGPFCFPKPFIEALLVKNMIAGQWVDLIKVFDML